jgi:hypothetical protein
MLATAACAWLATGALLFGCYLQISRTVPVDSDGAANALQAWDMLHGNLLLRGWRLSDVSFYTTELPQYMLIELARGLSPDVVHVAGAITFTLLVLLAAMLARGRRRGREAAVRMGIAAGIMLAPQLGGVYVLMLDPDHTGTSVPVLLVWLLLDRAPRRWYVPVAATALLGWALVADEMVMIIGVLPLLAVCCARCYQGIVRERLPPRSRWFELSLAAGALISAALAKAALALIAGHGGFRVWPVGSQLASYGELPRHLLLTGQGLLLLFGADFFSQHLNLAAALAMLHWVGLALAAWAACAAVRRFADGSDLVTQVLVAAVAIDLAAYVSGIRAVDVHSTREIAAVLPCCAVLAGRLLARRLDAAGMVPALLIAATGYLLCLGREMAQPAQPAQGQQLAGWLAAHHLDYGLAGYWQAASTTLASRGTVQVLSVLPGHGTVTRGSWETDSSWYDPLRHTATFFVLPPGEPGIAYPWTFDVRAAFGQPARIYDAGPYTVLVWNRNLLTGLR